MKKQIFSPQIAGPLTRKVTMILILVILIPSILLSGYVYRTLVKGYTDTIIRERERMLNQTVSQIDAQLTSMQNKCRYIANNNVVVHLLRRGSLVEFPIYTKHYVEDAIALLRYTFEYGVMAYRDICIYSDNEALPVDSAFYPESNLRALDFWPRQFEPGRISFLILDGEQTAQYYEAKDGSSPKLRNVALVIYEIYDYYKPKSLGKLVLEILPGNLFAKIFNAQSQCLIMPDYTHCFGERPASIAPGELKNAEGRPIARDNRYYSFIVSDQYGYILLDSEGVSAGGVLNASLRQAMISVVIPVIIIIAFLLLIRYFFKRIHQSITTMDAIIGNHYKGRIENIQQDELGQLDARYNQMLDTIASQAEELEREVVNRKLAQYEALRQQLNPHFIYNTLNLFSGVAQQSGDYALGDSIAFFGHLLHYNLKEDQIFTTLSEEMQNARSLVSVYALDPEKNISISADVPQTLMNMRVLKFLLQPLVENSIAHGLTRGKPLLLWVCARVEEGMLTIQFRDNGSGIDPNRLAQIREVLSNQSTPDTAASPGHSFIGLNNINKRLRLYYGDSASLSVQSAVNEYSLITMTFPAAPDSASDPT